LPREACLLPVMAPPEGETSVIPSEADIGLMRLEPSPLIPSNELRKSLVVTMVYDLIRRRRWCIRKVDATIILSSRSDVQRLDDLRAWLDTPHL
jgi:hypothetical protein